MRSNSLSFYIKLFIKDVTRKFGLKLEKLSETDKLISSINKVSNLNDRVTLLNDFIKKKPNSPFLHLSLAQTLHQMGDQDKFIHFEKYNIKRKEWLISTGLRKMNLEFIWRGMVTGSLGNHYPLESIITAQKVNLKENTKLNILIPKSVPLRNADFYKYFSPYINTVKDDETILSLNNLSNILELPLGLCVPFDNSCPSLDAASNMTQSRLGNQKLFNLSEADKSKGKKVLESIGLDKNSWYVTLHARDVGFRNENKKNTSDNFRNTEINSYIEAIKLITKAGGWVFRMGDSNMKKLDKIPQCIDYAHSDIRSSFMDVFLGATSRFCIGTSSGYYHIPFIFSVPVLFTNSPRFEEYYGLRKNDLYLPRLLKEKNKTEALPMSAFMSTPIGIYSNLNSYKKNNLDVIPNTSDEIYYATQEMLNKLENKNNEISISQKQKLFKEEALKQSSSYFYNSLVPQAEICNYFIDKTT